MIGTGAVRVPGARPADAQLLERVLTRAGPPPPRLDVIFSRVEGGIVRGDDVPVVSVGVPVFNGERYLDDVLTGLRAQTFTDLEIVVCDNGSTDGTERICRGHVAADPRVRYVRNPRNLGLAGNFNRVFALSRGRYFRWNMADDRVEPGLVSACVAVLDAEPGTVLAVPGWDLVDGEGRPTRLDERAGIPLQRWPDDRQSRLAELSAYVTGPRSIGVLAYLSGLVRAEAMWATGLLGAYPRSDRVLLTRLAGQGTFRELDGVLQHIRIHPASAGSGIGDRDYARVWPTFHPDRPQPRTLLPWRVRVHLEQVRALVAAADTPRDAVRLSAGYLRSHPRQLLG